MRRTSQRLRDLQTQIEIRKSRALASITRPKERVSLHPPYIAIQKQDKRKAHKAHKTARQNDGNNAGRIRLSSSKPVPHNEVSVLPLVTASNTGLLCSKKSPRKKGTNKIATPLETPFTIVMKNIMAKYPLPSNNQERKVSLHDEILREIMGRLYFSDVGESLQTRLSVIGRDDDNESKSSLIDCDPWTIHTDCIINSGEYGCIYYTSHSTEDKAEMPPKMPPKYVCKTNIERIEEITIAMYLGAIGIGPKVYDAWSLQSLWPKGQGPTTYCMVMEYIVGETVSEMIEKISKDYHAKSKIVSPELKISHLRTRSDHSTLKSRVETCGKMLLPDAILRNIVETLKRVMECGIRYEDSHTGNLLVRKSDSQVMALDMGFARWISYPQQWQHRHVINWFDEQYEDDEEPLLFGHDFGMYSASVKVPWEIRRACRIHYRLTAAKRLAIPPDDEAMVRLYSKVEQVFGKSI